MQLNNALGLEFGGRKEYDRSFEFIERCNVLQREQEFYDRVDNEERIDLAIEVFAHQFLENHTGDGDPESELGAGVYTLSNDDGAWFGTGTNFGDTTIVSLVGADGYAGLNAAVMLDYETFEFEGAIYPEFMLGETADTASTD